MPALSDVDLELRRGEVHVLLGENGAGKTTLSNVLAGIYRADAGHVEVDGVEQQFHSPAHAIAAGIGMVHQHFKLVAPMTVAENIHLGWEDTPRRVRRRELVARTAKLMDEFGLRVDPEAKIWQLSVGEQQRVEILRVLARGARILILDEPTAVLTTAEAERAVQRDAVAGGRRAHGRVHLAQAQRGARGRRPDHRAAQRRAGRHRRRRRRDPSGIGAADDG